MLPHQRPELASGNNFAFSNPIHKEHMALNRSHEMEYDTWAERIKGQCNHFGKPTNAKFGAWTRRYPKSNNPDKDELGWLARAEKDEQSGTPSLELWKREKSLVLKSQSLGSSPVRSYGYFNHISHGARAQTIAKYRQEMLDSVRGMPETAYELSLRDIVESLKITTLLQEAAENKSEEGKDEDATSTNKNKNKKKQPLLKMFIPKARNVFGSRKSTGSSGSCAKVLPNMLGDGEKSGSDQKSTDREWWSVEFGQMTSSSGSSNSINSSGRRSRSKLKGCYPFFQSRQK